jgi:Uma2 family endonuclease
MQITLSDEPEIEYLDGVAHSKMSPKRRHGRLQLYISRLLEDQGGAFGETVPGWRCNIGAADGTETRFVRDVAWSSDERLAALSDEEVEEPPFAPDIVVEIRSPGDGATFLRRKIARYLSTGARLVLDVDPTPKTIAAHNAAGVQILHEGERFASETFTWLSIDVTLLFSAARRHKRQG